MRAASAAGVSPEIAQDGAYVKSLLAGHKGDNQSEVQRIELDFPIGQGEHLHTIIKFTFQSLINRRVLLLLPGPVENIHTYDYDVPDYNAGDIVAEHGYIAVAMDPYGNTGSSQPSDGRQADMQNITEHYKRAIDRLKFVFHVDSVDIYGEGGMGGLACLLLAQDETRAHSCSSSGQLYIHPSSTVINGLFSPFVYFSLLNFITPSPFNTNSSYYLDTLPIAPIVYGGATVGVPAEIATQTLTLQPGTYPIGYFLEGFKVTGVPSGSPEVVVDAKPARVPGLVINDADDLVADNGCNGDPSCSCSALGNPFWCTDDVRPSDNQILVDDYGTAGGNGATATLKVTAAGAHAPRLGVNSHAQFWTYLFEFLDSLED